jgi:hypothetical protein
MKRWWNTDIKERSKAVERENRGRRISEGTVQAKAEPLKSVWQSMNQMWSDDLHNRRVAKMWRAA